MFLVLLMDTLGIISSGGPVFYSHPQPLNPDLPTPQFNRKEVVSHYSEYVNNFTEAMAILEKAIKKSKFVTFLKDKYTQSKTSLSLQGLLLKPIQRFPQYILFLQVRAAGCTAMLFFLFFLQLTLRVTIF